ncbi:MAG: acetylornithine/succinylornithine family transaminase [Acidimicrobiales bacterium]
MTPEPTSPSLMATYAPAPVRFVSGRGTELFDDEGRRYLDFLAGIAVVSLGHCNKHVVDAIAQQAARLMHVSNLFHNELNERLARDLDRLVGDGSPAGGQVFFSNSGAEANECAIKLARRVGGPGRYVVVSALGSFHGRTLATLAATGQPRKHEAFLPLPEGFRSVAYGDLGALEDAVGSPSVAAVLLEAIQGEAGVVVPPAGYLTAVRRVCDEHGILLMLDEIQTGLARTGRWFAFQHEAIGPDVVTVAKSLGNGMPIGACWARRDVAAAFVAGDHGSTFGGQPLACAAGIATLAELEAIDAPGLARRTGAYLAQRLEALAGVASVRGKGLLLAAVLEPGLDASEVARSALRLGLVLNAPVPGVLRLAPPLTVSTAEVDQAVGMLGAALESVSNVGTREGGQK